MAKTLAEIRQEINSFTKYSPEESVYHFPRLWQELQDEVSATLLDLIDHIEAGEGAVYDFEVGRIIRTTNPNFNPNTETDSEGRRKYAGTWVLIPESLVPYTATTNAGDYQLTSNQFKQILTSWRNISLNNLPSGNIPLGGQTSEPVNPDGSVKDLSWRVDLQLPFPDYSNYNMYGVQVSGNIQRGSSISPAIASNVVTNWGYAMDSFASSPNHNHSLSSAYVKFNESQQGFDVRQKGYLGFEWRRSA